MQLEEAQVLRSRNPFRVLFKEWRNKEWWYSGTYDPQSGAYFSWYVVRVNFVDQITVTLFDPKIGKPIQEVRRLWLKKIGGDDGLWLEAKGFCYRGNPKDGWSLKIDMPKLKADLQIANTIEPFTKFDNEILQDYGLLHFFHNQATGTVSAQDKGQGHSYELEKTWVYYDHCFGRVPTQTGWHWLAVQNDDIALASLVNYGPRAQTYTQGFFKAQTQSPRTEQWVRLEQSVSFERLDWGRDDFKKPWRITSSDLDLQVELLMAKTDIQRILPIIGYPVAVNHTEVFGCAQGKIRVDGTWLDSGKMYGVMEEHYGRW